jgi:hypothetical protein
LLYIATWKTQSRPAEKNPGHTEWQRDLSVSHEKIGNVLLRATSARGGFKPRHDDAVVNLPRMAVLSDAAVEHEDGDGITAGLRNSG